MSDTDEKEPSPLQLALKEVVEAFGARAAYLLMIAPDGSIHCVGASQDQEASVAIASVHQAMHANIPHIQAFVQNMMACTSCQAKGVISTVAGDSVPCIACGGKRFVEKKSSTIITG